MIAVSTSATTTFLVAELRVLRSSSKALAEFWRTTRDE